MLEITDRDFLLSLSFNRKMAVTRRYLPFIFITILYQDMIKAIEVKQTKCQRVVHRVAERTNYMKCGSDEVIYVKNQAITSGSVSVGDQEKSCAANLEKGVCTRSLPLDSSNSDGTPFIAATSCNLKNTCVLNENLLKYKTFDLFNESCRNETILEHNWTKDSLFTSFTYFCVPKNLLFNLLESNRNTIKTSREIHLVMDDFYGNITCEMKGTIHLLSILELTEANLTLYRDGEKLYSNGNRCVYGTNITLNNDFNTNNTRYIIKIHTELEGRVWIHLQGHLEMDCSRKSELNTLKTVDTDKNLTTFNINRKTVRSKGKISVDLKSDNRMFLLLFIGLVVALTIMIGIYLLQRRKDKEKLNEITLQTDRISINFTEHGHVSEMAADRATGEGNIYSEISSTRENLLHSENDTQTQDIN
ncbi:uncharacterized protein LOC134229091 [Saccostrea cucullata]|uniref:uncharacterized protein LOC134229091 n=1 Tax=Saccostrea cuccullata TaxID=36930 RepID=UPI002ED41C1B